MAREEERRAAGVGVGVAAPRAVDTRRQDQMLDMERQAVDPHMAPLVEAVDPLMERLAVDLDTTLHREEAGEEEVMEEEAAVETSRLQRFPLVEATVDPLRLQLQQLLLAVDMVDPFLLPLPQLLLEVDMVDQSPPLPLQQLEVMEDLCPLQLHRLQRVEVTVDPVPAEAASVDPVLAVDLLEQRFLLKQDMEPVVAAGLSTSKSATPSMNSNVKRVSRSILWNQ